MIGIWLKREYLQGGIIDKKVACSNCHYESGHVMSNWKYCPVCGSRNAITDTEYKELLAKHQTKANDESIDTEWLSDNNVMSVKQRNELSEQERWLKGL